jgi:hypothetical protein
VNVVAVTDAPARGLRAIEVGSVAAVLDDTAAPAAGRAAVLRHGAAVDRVFAACSAVLPTRAGSQLADEHAVRAWLEAEHDVLERALDRVRDGAEIALTWRADAVPGTAFDSGGDYLRVLAGRAASARTARGQLDAVRDLPGVRGTRTLAETTTMLKASVLVVRRQADPLRARLAVMRTPAGSWTASGPFPPYSFVGEDWS